MPAVPAWLFPLLPAAASNAAPFDTRKPLHVPRSQRNYTEAQLNDLFAAPDWHPDTHAAMPDIVARGRAPEVFACGYCHTAGGQGRPENASLAGLPAQYLVQQLDDFRSGARRSAWPESYRPAERMIQAARHATIAEAAAAARYFSQQKLRAHVRVVETTSVPRSRVVGWVYAVLPGGGNEALGQRLLEFTPDPARAMNIGTTS
jgi:cytochrome c553